MYFGDEAGDLGETGKRRSCGSSVSVKKLPDCRNSPAKPAGGAGTRAASRERPDWSPCRCAGSPARRGGRLPAVPANTQDRRRTTGCAHRAAGAGRVAAARSRRRRTRRGTGSVRPAGRTGAVVHDEQRREVAGIQPGRRPDRPGHRHAQIVDGDRERGGHPAGAPPRAMPEARSRGTPRPTCRRTRRRRGAGCPGRGRPPPNRRPDGAPAGTRAGRRFPAGSAPPAAVHTQELDGPGRQADLLDQADPAQCAPGVGHGEGDAARVDDRTGRKSRLDHGARVQPRRSAPGTSTGRVPPPDAVPVSTSTRARNAAGVRP